MLRYRDAGVRVPPEWYAEHAVMWRLATAEGRLRDAVVLPDEVVVSLEAKLASFAASANAIDDTTMPPAAACALVRAQMLEDAVRHLLAARVVPGRG